MYLQTLGKLELQGAAYSRPKSLLLLCHLALEGARDRHHLSALFFGQAHDPHGSLRSTIRRLRQEAPGSLEQEGEFLRTAVHCDARDMLTWLDACELERGIGLYTGPFLAGLRRADWGVELEEWVYTTREYLASRVRSALLTLAEGQAATGSFGAAADLAERALELEGAAEPEAEEFGRLDCLLVAGHSPLVARLRQQGHELGLDLHHSVEDARRALLSHAAESAGASLDIEARPHLPSRITEFVGREVERGEIVRALARPEVRLLTLVGPGGSGKTRLALEVARALQARQAVAFASLEAVAELRDLPRAIAHAAGLNLPGDQPPLPALQACLQGPPLLMVLDGVEHLLEGTEQLQTLLRGCPSLTLLLTSRERLNLEEEWALTIGGLNLPPPGATVPQIRDAEAVQLFVMRARRASLGFRPDETDWPVVAQIAALVDGSPLGLELAAAWIRLLPLEEIARETRRSLDFLQTESPGVPQRHHSVRAVFEQTWAQLSEAEQTVMARLSVFHGGFTREAAGEVAGASLPVLARLLDKSLIRVMGAGRYGLHALIVQFTRERLRQTPKEQRRAQLAHAAFYRAQVQQAYTAFLNLRDERQWMDRLTLELDNLRAVLKTWLDWGEPQEVLRCVTWLRVYWGRTGRAREGRWWLSLGLAAGLDTPPDVREQALAVQGELAMDMGDHLEARRLLEASLALREQLGLPSPITWLHLGNVAVGLGETAMARQWYEQARAGFQAANERHGLASSLKNLGSLMLKEGDLAGAQAAYEQSLRYKLEIGGEVDGLHKNFGDLYRQRGEFGAARSSYTQALRGLLNRGYLLLIPGVLEGLGRLSLDQGQGRRGAVLLAAATMLEEHLGCRTSVDLGHLEGCRRLGSRAGCRHADFDVAWATGRTMTLEQAVAYSQDERSVDDS
ncbi:ATP-binding protein [Deinococcus radiopugnans]|uniref:ATPase n=1 Tax=Deinococcus radiopugnans ATCC 19172 TaxID=585398 RepID=A0A5C4XVZ0_9DEIO|nr:tetratricopeptide repeat protein [Deinococcus radiopugnans]MBB6018583.1 putative ATPase [Deinococcus radiopugnans ATCC 19172]TNM67285.1 tetratricopeptide repeat protein [Deinococcus radiopugnans ATCC 19172]